MKKKDTADLETDEIMDCRPICKGDSIKKVITKALYKSFMNTIEAGCEPSQFAVETNGDVKQLIMAIGCQSRLGHVRYTEFIRGIMDEIPPLLPQTHDGDGELHGK